MPHASIRGLFPLRPTDVLQLSAVPSLITTDCRSHIVDSVRRSVDGPLRKLKSPLWSSTIARHGKGMRIDGSDFGIDAPLCMAGLVDHLIRGDATPAELGAALRAYYAKSVFATT